MRTWMQNLDADTDIHTPMCRLDWSLSQVVPTIINSTYSWTNQIIGHEEFVDE